MAITEKEGVMPPPRHVLRNKGIMLSQTIGGMPVLGEGARGTLQDEW